MVTMPAATPVTMPVDDPTVAVPVAPEDHVPPLVASASVSVLPTHTPPAPVIAAGMGYAVTVVVVLVAQLPLEAVAVYVIGVADDTDVGCTYSVVACVDPVQAVVKPASV